MLRRFIKNNQGAVMFLFGGALGMLIIVTGLAIDMSRYLIVKSKLRAALDAALLAAAAKPETAQENVNMQEVAEQFFFANFPEEYMDVVVIESTSGNLFNINVDTTNGLSVEGTVNSTLSLSFGGLIGLDSVSVTHHAQVIRDVNTNVEVAVMMDISGSMCVRNLNATGGSGRIFEVDENCTKFHNMKNAVGLFIEEMLNNIAIQQLSIGLVPFNHKVRFPDTSTIPPTVLANEVPTWDDIPIWGPQTAGEYYSNFDDAGSVDNPLAPIVSLTSDKASLLEALEALTISHTSAGWTRINLGLHTSWLMLDPEHKDYFDHDKNELPREYSPMTVDKAVILMTDGTNVSCCFSSINGDYDRGYLYRYAPDDENLRQMCEGLKQRGVIIFSVLYGIEDIEVGRDEIIDIFHECASNDQFYFQVDADEDIELTYKTIASTFYKLRVTQ